MTEPGGEPSERTARRPGLRRVVVGHVAIVAAALAVAPGRSVAQPSATPPSPTPTDPVTPPAPATIAPAPAGPATIAPATAAPDAPTGPRDIVILTPGSRSRNTDILLASVAGAAVILGGVGVYWNLDANTAANNVSATTPTGLPWTAAEQHEYDRAHDSSIKAGVFYGIGGALLVGAIVGFIATAPTPHKDVIHPRMAHVEPTLAPTPNGAVLGGAWRF